MILKPLDLVWERAQISKSESDFAYFWGLLNFGEALTKTIVSALTAAIQDDPDRHRYRLEHSIAHADGIGVWADNLRDILIGPASQFLTRDSSSERREMTMKVSSEEWQYESILHLRKALHKLDIEVEDMPRKVDLLRWHVDFSTLRNKTRGHGAHPPENCSKVCKDLERSLAIYYNNFSLFKRPWAFLYRNLSGKYRVTPLTKESEPFEQYKSISTERLPNGIYIYFTKLYHVSLIKSGPDAIDFMYLNGNFTDKKYETISYITGVRVREDSTRFLAPPGTLPPSETEGLTNLDVVGNVFTNIPKISKDYITRDELEGELNGLLIDDRHPVVTLHGRGGIGKTSLALAVCEHLAQSRRFEIMLWFSARDIDLHTSGPKSVRPHIISEKDIADLFTTLVTPNGSENRKFNKREYFEKNLTKSNYGSCLFIFDNFETSRDPVELYSWIDTFIRSPNKILITTRFREFKGDYPVEVGGMGQKESFKLIDTTAQKLGISHLLNSNYKERLHLESEGHPYVLKILLGEIAKLGKQSDIKRIVARREDILTSLFERTYESLDPAEKRVFLTLSGWNSAVPEVVVYAVLLRTIKEKIDIQRAIESLIRSSLVEIVQSPADGQSFLVVLSICGQSVPVICG